jgi:hypothetical protein
MRDAQTWATRRRHRGFWPPRPWGDAMKNILLNRKVCATCSHWDGERHPTPSTRATSMSIEYEPEAKGYCKVLHIRTEPLYGCGRFESWRPA